MAFITGSRAYGTPKEDSDVDLVIFVSHADAQILRNNADTENYDYFGDNNNECNSIRYGNLNIIITTSLEKYKAWQAGTTSLKAFSPVTREKAVQVLRELVDDKFWYVNDKA